MNNIFQTLLYQREKQKDTVLATIVWDDGSAPRGAGSQMLVGAEGLLSGTIGGGAVELRSIQLARALLAGQHVDALYDFKLSRDGELGMACGGDVTVLFTPARLSDRVWDALAAEVLRRVRDRVPGWLVLPLDGAAPHIAETAETGEGVFSLPLPVGERAVIFGAGHIARALTPLLRTIGFRPVVVDDRPGFATAEHFPQADRTICGDFDRISDYLTLTPEDYVVIMTNGHEHDFQAEVQVLRGETAYVGVIGSRKKTAFVNQRLREAGIPEEKIAFVHTPVGTPIKAVTPEEIAAVDLALIAPDSLQQETAEGLTLESTLCAEEPSVSLVERIALRDAIDALPEKERKTILLRFFKGLTQEQTARILQVSQVQVSRLERRSLQKLRDLLAEE